jgi:hypothetical protein
MNYSKVQGACSPAMVGFIFRISAAPPDDAEVLAAAPQQCLNFFPLPHGQGSLRPVFMIPSLAAFLPFAMIPN